MHPLPTDPRHQRFADLILRGESQVDAYLGAGYKCKRESAHHSAKRLIKTPEVQAYLESVRTASADDTTLTVLEKRKFLARVVRTSISDIDPEKEGSLGNMDLVKSFARSESDLGSNERIEKLDPLKAIEIDNKLAGDDAETNVLKDLAEALGSLGGPVIPVDRM